MLHRKEEDYHSLKEKYKNFFKMIWGFECGPGWYDIIEKLSDDINAIIERDGLEDVYATQIKEKYGTLRYYLSTETDEISDLISKAEKQTEVTCEQCGKAGEIGRDGYWIRVKCKDCR